MNLRVLRTELLRSAALWAGLTVLVAGSLFLFAIDGSWWRGTVRWTGQWTSLALWTRVLLAYLWPVAAGIGALYGLRDHRSRMPELLATTPRPGWQRAATPATAIAVALVTGFGALLVCGGVLVALGPASYTHLGWLPISAVALLALVSAGVFGMGVARALPSPLTPPALAVLFLAANVLLMQQGDSELPTARVGSHLFSQLSPAVAEPRQALLTLTGSVHLGQSLWFLGLLATGFALLGARNTRGRLLSVVPVLAGAALALLVLPGDARGSYRVDPAAAAQVCEGRVCVTELQRPRLEALAPTAARALDVLDTALGDVAPHRVREETALRAVGADRRLVAGSVLVNFEDPQIGGAEGDQLLRRLVGEGLAPSCRALSSREFGGDEVLVVQSVLASWALGTFRPIEADVYDRDAHRASLHKTWKEFSALSPERQRSRAAEVREAALRCEFTWAEELAGGAR
ncbi:hypothetical protein OH733_34395 [Streptomyces griseus]|uniref:hypothetical protein n=1 Tax=Streptomyces griseus TaxID=1911 RepID=UPI0038662456|nr:hypothetical protein OH733_34395 [Streptomyces griseus]WTD65848.1 hypothetical protein OH763_02595 [Streptomyces griseus]